MNCNPTLTAEEFKVLHNTLCELDMIGNDKVQALVERIRDVALKSAYEQEDQAFDRKQAHYGKAREDLGLTSVWSMYEVDSLNHNHPYPSDAIIVYTNGPDGKTVRCVVNGSNWVDVYVAANECIRNSGDQHHIYIEAFSLQNGNELHMTTGS